MSTEAYSDDFFTVPTYALVIGISKYKYGNDVIQELGEKEFPNLKVAAKDAEDFARFLERNGGVKENIRLLVNEQADSTTIRQEFYELSKKSKSNKTEKPLFIVYFSGHGWAEDAEEEGDPPSHYLIPYDAECDRLFATALSTETFDDLLSKLQTNKLVVFLDACHSGAMGAVPNAKGPGPAYNPAQDLGEGEGRYIIASCKPGQRSWEGERNSIFTEHLLGLLSCDSDDITDEVVTTYNLFTPLRNRVKAAAEAMKRKQEPIIPKVEEGDGIVLAINSRVRKERLAGEAKDREDKIKFLIKICARLEKLKSPRQYMIRGKLEDYVYRGDKKAGHDPFYGIFGEYYELWKPAPDEARVEECCSFLIRFHEEATKAVQVKEPQPQEPSQPADKFVKASESKVIGEEATTTPRTLSASPQPEQQHQHQQQPPQQQQQQPQQQHRLSADDFKVTGSEVATTPRAPAIAPQLDQPQQRRLLSTDDIAYILEDLMGTQAYYADNRVLRIMLSQPVNANEFFRQVNSMALKKSDPAFDALVDKLVERFSERWAEAKVVESKTLSNLMMLK
jgi:hypothetical protein